MSEITALLDRTALDEALRRWTVEGGQRLRKRRQELTWTQTTLAKLTGTTTETVCRVELGAIAPRENLKVALAYAVQLEVEDLWPPMSRQEVYRSAGES